MLWSRRSLRAANAEVYPFPLISSPEARIRSAAGPCCCSCLAALRVLTSRSLSPRSPKTAGTGLQDLNLGTEAPGRHLPPLSPPATAMQRARLASAVLRPSLSPNLPVALLTHQGMSLGAGLSLQCDLDS